MERNNRRRNFQCSNPGCSFASHSSVGVRFHQSSCKFQRRQEVSRNRKRTQSSLPPPSDRQRKRRSYAGRESGETSSDQHLESSPIAVNTSQVEGVPGVDENGAGDHHTVLEDSLLSSLMIHLCNISRVTGRKQINEILTIINRPEFPHEKCREKAATAEDCQIHVDNKFNREFSEVGFKRVTKISRDHNLEYTYYHKDPVIVLQEQIAFANISNCFFDPVSDKNDGANFITCPLNAELGQFAIPAIKREIEKSEDDVMWKSTNSHGVQSFVGLGQLYSDKSSMTLKANGFSFYPLHLVLLNYNTHLRRHFIVSGKTTLAYLPVKFFDYADKSIEMKPDDSIRAVRLEAIHEAIEHVMSSLAAVAKKGFPCKDSQGVNRLCHFAIGSYCCDIPETKDLSGVLHGLRTKATCHRCLVPSENLNGIETAAERQIGDMQSLLEKASYLKKEAQFAFDQNDRVAAKNMRESAVSILKQVSLSGTEPVLRNFPFMGLVPTLNYYRMYTFETMHNFHLGISKLLKNAYVERLKDEELTSNRITAASGKPRSFPSIRSIVLSGANEIMRRIRNESHARHLDVDFSVPSKSWRYNGFFNESGIVGMLEARQYKAVDMVFPIVAAYIDRVCGETSNCPTTKTATKYCDIVLDTFRRSRRQGWTSSELHRLKEDIANFKTVCKNTYANYQPSRMGTLKFHLLDHLVEDLKRLGTVDVMDAGLFEQSHTRFKRKYKGSSQRHGTAMKESIREIHREEVYEAQKMLEQGQVSAQPRKRKNLLEGPQLTRDGPTTNLQEIGDARKQRSSQSPNGTKPHPTNTAHGILDDLGDKESAIFISQMTEWLGKMSGENCDTHESMFRRVTSAFVAGGSVPVASDYDPVTNNIVYRPSQRLIENRVVASRNFYKSGTLRQDFVLIKQTTESMKQYVKVGKVLLLLRCKANGEEHELMFVKYMVPVESEDEIDEELQCLKLKWETQERNGTLSPVVCIEPISKMSGSVHVIRNDYEIYGVQKEPVWYEKRFYVNRFYYDSEAKIITS